MYPGNIFGYFNIDKMKVFVEKVAASHETGAKFIINSGKIAESILPNPLNYLKKQHLQYWKYYNGRYQYL